MTTRWQRGRQAQPPNPQFWRQRGWQLSAAFLLLSLVGSLAAFLFSSDDSAMTGVGDSTAGVVDVQSQRSPCPTDDAQTSGTTQQLTKPPTVKWMKVGIAMVPTTPTDGPMSMDGPVWSCYSHTPIGAAVAAHVILAHMSDSDWRDVAARQLVPGPGRNAFVAGRSFVTNADAPGHAAATYAGFTVSSYQSDSATVWMLLKQPQGQLAATSVSMRWTDGDWKVAPRTDGSLYSPLDETVNSTAGFIMWGA